MTVGDKRQLDCQCLVLHFEISKAASMRWRHSCYILDDIFCFLLFCFVLFFQLFFGQVR